MPARPIAVSRHAETHRWRGFCAKDGGTGNEKTHPDVEWVFIPKRSRADFNQSTCTPMFSTVPVHTTSRGGSYGGNAPPTFIQTSLSNPCPTLLAGLSGQRYGDPTFGSIPIVIRIIKYAQGGPGLAIRQFLGRVMQTGLAGTGIPRPPLPFTSNIWGGVPPSLPPSLHLSPHRGCAVTFSRSETGVLIKPFPNNDRRFSHFFVVRL